MREILFRGKTLTGKWVEGAYYKQKLFYGDKEDADVIITSTENLTYDQALEFAICISETIGQYTGLTDKNGTKIFEGDIVTRDFGKVTHTYQISFDIELSAFIAQRNGGFSSIDDEFEIIGNIHDNPELLKPSFKPEYRDGDPDAPICPNCRTPLNEMEDCDCGQKIDWSEE